MLKDNRFVLSQIAARVGRTIVGALRLQPPAQGARIGWYDWLRDGHGLAVLRSTADLLFIAAVGQLLLGGLFLWLISGRPSATDLLRGDLLRIAPGTAVLGLAGACLCGLAQAWSTNGQH